MSSDKKRLSLREVEDLTRRALRACGANGQQLELGVQAVIDAECDGIQTVGLGYLPLYCGHLQVGKLKGDAMPRLETMLSALTNEPGVRLPGNRRHQFRQQAEQNGVEVPQELIDRLEVFASGEAA